MANAPSSGTGTHSSTANRPASHAMYDATRKRRKKGRTSGTSEDHAGELNITPMLDMMTILLVFLLKSFASSSTNVNVANLVLPYSATQMEVKEALQLMVSKDKILVDQKVVADMNEIMGAPAGPDGLLIPKLYDALRSRSDHFKRLEQDGGIQFQGDIAVIADKTLPYSIIYRVLYTCGHAEFGRFKLFVQKPT